MLIVLNFVYFNNTQFVLVMTVIIFRFCDRNVEIVKRRSHSGNICNTSQQDKDCVMLRRNKMIGQINDTLCSFESMFPFVNIDLLHTFCCI